MKRLIAVCCALAVALGVGAVWCSQGPSDAELSRLARENPVNPRGDLALWGQPALLGEMVKAQNEQGRTVGFLLGSSELSQAVEDSAHPVRFFAENDLGFSLISMGAGGFQSLWSAIETGALDKCGALPEKKIALLLGTQWFMNSAGCTPEAFFKSFSEDALKACLANEGLSDDTKAKIADRVMELGIDEGTVKDALSGTVIGKVNSAVADLMSVGDADSQLADVLSAGNSCDDGWGASVKIDWRDMEAKAEVEGEAACTNNDYGIYDDYWDTYVSDRPWGTVYEGEPFAEWSETEFYDLGLFLQVCKELGIEPLLVLEPVNGYYYDMQPYTKESRDVFNERVREVASEAEVALVDLSSHDYDKYYLRDVMHLGWKSWVQVDKALYEFYSSPGQGKGDLARGHVGTGTPTEALADEAETEMLEAEGAGKEVFDGEE